MAIWTGLPVRLVDEIALSRAAEAARIAFGLSGLTEQAERNAGLAEALMAAGAVVNIRSAPYNAVGDGSDATAAFAQAIADLGVLGGGELFVPRGRYLWSSNVAILAAQANVKLRGLGRGVSVIVKAFSGDLCSVTAAGGVEFHGLHFIGQYGTYTGRGLVFTGPSPYPRVTNCFFEGFSDSHVYFGADAGQDAQVTDCKFFITVGSGQPINQRFVQCAGTDSTAMKRTFTNCHGNGFYELTGALDTTIDSCMVTSVSIDNACSNTLIVATLWANTGVAMNIGGGNTCIALCRFSGDVTLIAGSGGSFIANVNSSGTFTNNATQANWTVNHHPLAAAYHLLAKHFLPANSSAGHVIMTASVVSPGDADTTVTPMSTGTILRIATPLTATRTATLSTTDAQNGNFVFAYRPLTATGAFDYSIGGLIKLGPGQSCMCVYNGSAWQLVFPYTTRVVANTAARTLTEGDRNATFTNEGAVARVDYSLPSAVAAFGPHTFYNQNVNGTRVIASAGDTIRIAAAVSAAAGRIDSVTVGDSVTLVAINATEWVAVAVAGAGWTAT